MAKSFPSIRSSKMAWLLFPSLCKVPSPVVQGPMLISTMTPVILDPNHHSWFLFPIRLWAPWGQMGLLFFFFLFSRDCRGSQSSGWKRIFRHGVLQKGASLLRTKSRDHVGASSTTADLLTGQGESMLFVGEQPIFLASRQRKFLLEVWH